MTAISADDFGPFISGRILVIDDEPNLCVVLQAVLERAGFEVVALSDSRAALRVLDEEEFDVVVTDLNMPEVDGFTVLHQSKLIHPDTPVVIITAYGTLDSAVNALKLGAFDFISKPFEQEELLRVIRKAVDSARLRREETRRFESLNLAQALGASLKMRSVYKLADQAARSDAEVLITGENGTGKERLAFEIHLKSERSEKPYIQTQASAIESDLEAREHHPTKWALASGGTLFLSDVDALSSGAQKTLLGWLEGNKAAGKGSVRLICAANGELDPRVSDGTFARALYDRISAFPIHLPALRERSEDVGTISEQLIKHLNPRLGKNISGIEPAAIEALKRYAWPGNIRELENTVERMMLLCQKETLNLDDIPLEVRSAQRGASDASGVSVTTQFGAKGSQFSGEESIDFKEVVRRQTQALERELIEKTLKSTRFNVTQAAERLNLSRKGLQLKMKELGIRRG